MPFCFTEDFYNRMKETGNFFYCPAGHRQHYTESEITKLKKQIEQKERELTSAREWSNSLRKQRDTAERKASAQKGVVTRIKNRIHNGVCPCCKRHFANLERHMKNQHPDFKNED